MVTLQKLKQIKDNFEKLYGAMYFCYIAPKKSSIFNKIFLKEKLTTPPYTRTWHQLKNNRVIDDLVQSGKLDENKHELCLYIEYTSSIGEVGNPRRERLEDFVKKKGNEEYKIWYMSVNY